MLLELCCSCGFVHRDGRINYRAYKPHYHWTPEGGELTQDTTTLHATLCVACCKSPIDWKEFYEQTAKTPEKYKVKWSLNAPLPDIYIVWATELYKQQTAYFTFD
jgi:hypothetical protein